MQESLKSYPYKTFVNNSAYILQYFSKFLLLWVVYYYAIVFYKTFSKFYYVKLGPLLKAVNIATGGNKTNPPIEAILWPSSAAHFIGSTLLIKF